MAAATISAIAITTHPARFMRVGSIFPESDITPPQFNVKPTTQLR